MRSRRAGRPAGRNSRDAAEARLVTTGMRATYRLMFGPGFGFREARALVPYLSALGVSHVYLRAPQLGVGALV